MPRTILILSSTPRDMAPLRVHEEVREIEEAIRRSRYRDEYRLVVRLGVRARDLHRVLLEHRPALVHFAGHACGGQGVVLEDEHGHSLLVSSTDLAEMFGHFKHEIECVVLNACHSGEQIGEIGKYIPFVVGMNESLDDRAAISFAIAFYDSLTSGESIASAYGMACSAVSVHGLAVDRVATLTALDRRKNGIIRKNSRQTAKIITACAGEQKHGGAINFSPLSARAAVSMADLQALTVHLNRTTDGRIEVRYQIGEARFGSVRLVEMGRHVAVFTEAADRGDERTISRILSRVLANLGADLFQMLLGNEHTWEPLLRMLHGETDPAVPSPTPAAWPVHVRICTTDSVLASIPWRLTAWSHRLLVLDGWRFAVTRRLHPEEVPSMQVPTPVLVVAPHTRSATAGDVHRPEHSEDVRQVLARAWPSSRNPRYVNVARTRRELVTLLAGMRPAIVYVYAALEQCDGEPYLLLDPDDGRSAADPLRVAELPRIFYEADCRPFALYLDTGGAVLPAATLYSFDVPLLLWRRLPVRSPDVTQLALRWLTRWLEDGDDPVEALHQVGRELGLTVSAEAATIAIRAEYRQLRTQLDEHLRITGEPLMYLDRKEAKDAAVGYLETLAGSPTRRVTAIVAYASPGNHVAKLAEQLKDELRRRQTSRFAVNLLRLELPLSFHYPSKVEGQHGRLRAELDADLRRQLEAHPDEPLGNLLQHRAPRAMKSGRPILWLDWGSFGHTPERPLLKGQHLDAWLHFAAETLAGACPPNLRVVSYLALETEQPEKVHNKLTELHRVMIGYDRFELDEIQLGKLNERHLLKYLRDHTDCPPALHVEISQCILVDTGGAFARTVSWLERGVQSGWRDLVDELRRLQGAAVLNPDDDDLG